MSLRLVNRDELWTKFVQHYWDSCQKDRDLILTHIENVMRMVPTKIEEEP
jgi:hypothetical protein